MTARDDLTRILARNRRAMDAERRELAAWVDAILAAETRGRDTFDALAYVRVQRALQPVFDAFYGRWPGDEQARFLRLMLAQTRAARGLALRRAVQDIRRRLRRETDVLAAIEAEAA